jgi:biopolymer transport protein ExbB
VTGTGCRRRQGGRHRSVENPYGLEALWKGSDAVAKTVLLLLLS